MPTYQLSDTAFDATGIVTVRESWIDVDGKRQRSGQPELNADGLPLYEIGTTRPVKEWDRLVEKLAAVVVPSATKPQVKRHQRLKFKDLTVDVRVNRTTGQIIETFTATGIENV